MTSGMVSVVGSFAVGLCLRAERWPVAGETVLGRDFDQGPGGKGSNQAVQAARLGCAVEMIGAIGEDAFGRMALDLYAAEGVGTAHVRRTSERNTGIGFIVLDGAGTNRIVLDPGANETLGPRDVEGAREVIERSDVVVTQLEIPTAAARAALATARHASARTILNPAPARLVTEEVLALVDLLTPNQTEARILVGLPPDDPRDDEDVAAELLRRGAGSIVMTRGEHGALVVTPEGGAVVGSHAVGVVDSTGAGDAFTGTLAAGLAQERSLEEAVHRACAAGALACTTLGVIPSLPDAARLDQFLRAPGMS